MKDELEHYIGWITGLIIFIVICIIYVIRFFPTFEELTAEKNSPYHQLIDLSQKYAVIVYADYMAHDSDVPREPIAFRNTGLTDCNDDLCSVQGAVLTVNLIEKDKVFICLKFEDEEQFQKFARFLVPRDIRSISIDYLKKEVLREFYF